MCCHVVLCSVLQENSSDSELKELNRLQAGFFTYNRLADDEK